MNRRVPASLADPDAPVDNADLWIKLNKLAGGNPVFKAVEIKSFYVIGLLSEICRSVEWLLGAKGSWPSKYLPAYILFASSVDLLGRCLIGNQTPDLQGNLALGFLYLANPTECPPPSSVAETDQEKTVVVKTELDEYTIADLVALRHLAAHGQATAKKPIPGIHIGFLEQFPERMGSAVETYWHGLQTNTEFCGRVGRALVGAYANRAEPLQETIRYFAEGNSAGDLFYTLDWRGRS